MESLVVFDFVGKQEFENYIVNRLAGDFKFHLANQIIKTEKNIANLEDKAKHHDALVDALKSARHMLWAAKSNMQNDGSPESLELAVMIAKEDLRELDKLIEKFEGES